MLYPLSYERRREEQSTALYPSAVPIWAVGIHSDGQERLLAIGEFAVAYAEQNELDYQRLLNAIEGRRLPAIAGL